jgi:hypothetical protein
VVIDYRLLQGKHRNTTPLRRDCLLLSFAPDWQGLSGDIKAHLVQHPALPTADEAESSRCAAHAAPLPGFEARPLTCHSAPPAGGIRRIGLIAPFICGTPNLSEPCTDRAPGGSCRRILRRLSLRARTESEALAELANTKPLELDQKRTPEHRARIAHVSS